MRWLTVIGLAVLLSACADTSYLSWQHPAGLGEAERQQSEKTATRSCRRRPTLGMIIRPTSTAAIATFLVIADTPSLGTNSTATTTMALRATTASASMPSPSACGPKGGSRLMPRVSGDAV